MVQLSSYLDLLQEQLGAECRGQVRLRSNTSGICVGSEIKLGDKKTAQVGRWLDAGGHLCRIRLRPRLWRLSHRGDAFASSWLSINQRVSIRQCTSSRILCVPQFLALPFRNGIPSLRILDRSELGFTPNSSAAPPGPWILPPAWSRTRSI